jgi:hypothetical protein
MLSPFWSASSLGYPIVFLSRPSFAFPNNMLNIALGSSVLLRWLHVNPLLDFKHIRSGAQISDRKR